MISRSIDWRLAGGLLSSPPHFYGAFSFHSTSPLILDILRLQLLLLVAPTAVQEADALVDASQAAAAILSAQYRYSVGKSVKRSYSSRSLIAITASAPLRACISDNLSASDHESAVHRGRFGGSAR